MNKSVKILFGLIVLASGLSAGAWWVNSKYAYNESPRISLVTNASISTPSVTPSNTPSPVSDYKFEGDHLDRVTLAKKHYILIVKQDFTMAKMNDDPFKEIIQINGGYQFKDGSWDGIKFAPSKNECEVYDSTGRFNSELYRK